MASKAQELRVPLSVFPLLGDHHGLELIVKDLTSDPTQILPGMEVAAEAEELAPTPPISGGAELTPVYLGVLPRTGLEATEGFLLPGTGTRTSHVPLHRLIAALLALLLDLQIELGGAELFVPLQTSPDVLLVGIQLRGPL